MTCIAGLVANGKVYMGADSAGVSGLDLRVRADQKMFRKGPFLIGCTTSFRMQQIIQYEWELPGHPEEMGLMEFMVREFVGTLRKALTTGGFAKKNSEQEEGGDFLVGYRGFLFNICSDFQVAQVQEAYSATGCGAAYALGSLFATADQTMLPDHRIEAALRAAENFSAGVRGPFYVDVI